MSTNRVIINGNIMIRQLQEFCGLNYEQSRALAMMLMFDASQFGNTIHEDIGELGMKELDKLDIRF